MDNLTRIVKNRNFPSVQERAAVCFCGQYPPIYHQQCAAQRHRRFFLRHGGADLPDAGDQGHLQRCLLLSDGGHPAAAGSVCPVGRLRPPHHRFGDEGGIRPLLHAGRPKHKRPAIMSSAPVSTSPPTWAAPRWSRSRYSATIAVCNLPNRAVTKSAGDLRLRLVLCRQPRGSPPLGGRARGFL